MSNDWPQQLADELHKPVTKNFQKRLVVSNGIDDIWAADLVEMQKFSKWNRGVKYLLMVIDVFSKYGWIRGLKDKKTETVIVKHLMTYSRVNVNQGCYGQIKVLSL